MKVIVSAAMSLDGYIDDASPERLKLSSPEDWDDVLELRERCDAIMVGAGTIRKDNPSLVIKDPEARARRVSAGLDADLIKVTVSMGGNLSPGAKFFTEGKGRKILFLGPDADATPFEKIATIVRISGLSMNSVVRFISTLRCKVFLVEGGTGVLTQFFEEDLVDELRLAVAPFFVGQAGAPRLVGEGVFPSDKDNRMELKGVRMLGDTAVMHYRVRRLRDREFLQMAVDESRKCKPVLTAYSVGAVIVTRDGEIFKGHTHETSPVNHAEEEAIEKARKAGVELLGATMYSSMEPCSQRASKPVSCSGLIIRNKFDRVVFAYNEPDHFVKCSGTEMLEKAGVHVLVITELAPQVVEINAHILK